MRQGECIENMLATFDRLRLRAGSTGDIHLKRIPGASFEYIGCAVELADPVSLNLEAPIRPVSTTVRPTRSSPAACGADWHGRPN
jgi:predicted DNA-binding helix-hairpin-helix protein